MIPSSCKCCGSGELRSVGEVEFNRTCLDRPGLRIFPPSSERVAYFACARCSFVFTGFMDAWSPDQFRNRVYNDDYIKADPPIPGRANVPVRERPAYSAGLMIADAFDGNQGSLRVLDFGSGGDPGPTGLALQDRNFRLYSYDPYRSDASPLPEGFFDVIIAIEVFEHCHDLQHLSNFMQERLAPEGLIWIQTMLHPHPPPSNILDSWYIAPRNGHISIFTLPAISMLFRRFGINIVLTSTGLFGFKRLPRFKNRIFV